VLALGALVGKGACVVVIDGVAVPVGKGVVSGKGVAVRAVVVGVVTGDLFVVCGVVAPGLGPGATVVAVVALGGGVETME
jgi:hypothetical protein